MSLQQSEEENEMYVINYDGQSAQTVAWDSWQQKLVNNFHGNHPGLYVVGNHYVKAGPDMVAHVQPADFYKKVDNNWKLIHEEGFDFNI